MVQAIQTWSKIFSTKIDILNGSLFILDIQKMKENHSYQLDLQLESKQSNMQELIIIMHHYSIYMLEKINSSQDLMEN